MFDIAGMTAGMDLSLSNIVHCGMVASAGASRSTACRQMHLGLGQRPQPRLDPKQPRMLPRLADSSSHANSTHLPSSRSVACHDPASNDAKTISSRCGMGKVFIVWLLGRLCGLFTPVSFDSFAGLAGPHPETGPSWSCSQKAKWIRRPGVGISYYVGW